MSIHTNQAPLLPASAWRLRASQYRETVQEITIPMRARRARREKHPVYDFLNTYYSFSLGRLERWHPGLGLRLQLDDEETYFSTKHYQHQPGELWLDPQLMRDGERDRLRRIVTLLERTQSRPPNFACHGLHEWAMVFSGADIRHRESVPLRLPQKEIDALVKSRPICCSHFDAFRFFAPDAISLNRLSPTLETREKHEQPGCIHANMDLYKWAYKSSPWVSSDLLLTCLFFAIEAREIDMRAAPYDLSDFGYRPIQIELPEGRREYEIIQHDLYKKGLKIREALLRELKAILEA